MELFGTQKVNKEGILTIGGVAVTDLAAHYGTPLYIMDEALIKENSRQFLTHFSSDTLHTEVIYASKAFLTQSMCKLIEPLGLSLDVVSGGELYLAHSAKFPMKRVYFHGNNKSEDELRLALKLNVGCIVIDHEEELARLDALMDKGRVQPILLRINPGIEAHTHEYIATTKNDSKFGVSIFNASTLRFIKAMSDNPKFDFLGFHSHIGSQIFNKDSFILHAETIMKYVNKVKEDLSVDVKAINLGGGFGVKYTDDDNPVAPDFLPEVLSKIVTLANAYNVIKPKVMIEPGRAIVANAGTTLYRVGSTKTTYSNKEYVFVDGSMADHMRTALYQARYHAYLANRMHDNPSNTYTVAGKACESGDVIIHQANLPRVMPNDYLAVVSTGAYHHSMASNYNMLTRPAVVFVENDKARLVIRRESYEDLLIRETEV